MWLAWGAIPRLSTKDPRCSPRGSLKGGAPRPGVVRCSRLQQRGASGERGALSDTALHAQSRLQEGRGPMHQTAAQLPPLPLPPFTPTPWALLPVCKVRADMSLGPPSS